MASVKEAETAPAVTPPGAGSPQLLPSLSWDVPDPAGHPRSSREHSCWPAGAVRKQLHGYLQQHSLLLIPLRCPSLVCSFGAVAGEVTLSHCHRGEVSRQLLRLQDSSTEQSFPLLQKCWKKERGLHQTVQDHSSTPYFSCIPEPNVTLSLQLQQVTPLLSPYTC